MSDVKVEVVGRELYQVFCQVTPVSRSEFQEAAMKLTKDCNQESILADEYRKYLTRLRDCTLRVTRPGKTTIHHEGRPADIIELEEELANERYLDFNPWSGFLCHLMGLPGGRWASEIDWMLDPGGP